MGEYEYLGDGVYACFERGMLWLRTGHHDEMECDNQIGLEPQVLEALNRFVERLKEEK